MHTYMCVCMSVYVCVCLCVCVQMCVCVNVRLLVCVFVRSCLLLKARRKHQKQQMKLTSISRRCNVHCHGPVTDGQEETT